MRAINGATCQFIKPRSTKVYSKGSMGYNLVYPENINTAPIKAQSKPNRIFFNMYKDKKSA